MENRLSAVPRESDFPAHARGGHVRLARPAMRTRFEIVLADEADPARLRAAGEEALDEISRVEEQLSAYRPESELSYVNARAADGPVRVEPSFFRLLEQASLLSATTEDAFDLTVGPLLRLWGLTGGEGALSRPPYPEEVETARGLVGFRESVRLDAEAGTVRFLKRGVRLDPGAIGKGYALDRAVDILREVGIESALLHGGTSTVCALGAPPDAEAWPVALRDPSRPDGRLASVALRDRALSVSTVEGKSVEVEGRRWGHVLDPRSGWPVRRSVLAAVVTEYAVDADALSTGLLVLGTAGFSGLAERRPDSSLLVAGEPSPGAPLDVEVCGRAFVRLAETEATAVRPDAP